MDCAGVLGLRIVEIHVTNLPWQPLNWLLRVLYDTLVYN